MRARARAWSPTASLARRPRRDRRRPRPGPGRDGRRAPASASTSTIGDGHAGLFSEAPSRVIALRGAGALAEVTERAGAAGVPVTRSGPAGGDRLVVGGLVDLPLPTRRCGAVDGRTCRPSLQLRSTSDVLRRAQGPGRPPSRGHQATKWELRLAVPAQESWTTTRARPRRPGGRRRRLRRVVPAPLPGRAPGLRPPSGLPRSRPRRSPRPPSCGPSSASTSAGATATSGGGSTSSPAPCASTPSGPRPGWSPARSPSAAGGTTPQRARGVAPHPGAGHQVYMALDALPPRQRQAVIARDREGSGPGDRRQPGPLGRRRRLAAAAGPAPARPLLPAAGRRGRATATATSDTAAASPRRLAIGSARLAGRRWPPRPTPGESWWLPPPRHRRRHHERGRAITGRAPATTPETAPDPSARTPAVVARCPCPVPLTGLAVPRPEHRRRGGARRRPDRHAGTHEAGEGPVSNVAAAAFATTTGPRPAPTPPANLVRTIESPGTAVPWCQGRARRPEPSARGRPASTPVVDDVVDTVGDYQRRPAPSPACSRCSPDRLREDGPCSKTGSPTPRAVKSSTPRKPVGSSGSTLPATVAQLTYLGLYALQHRGQDRRAWR